MTCIMWVGSLTCATFSVTLFFMFCIGRNMPCLEAEMCGSFSRLRLYNTSLPILDMLLDSFVRCRVSSESLEAWFRRFCFRWFPVAARREEQGIGESQQGLRLRDENGSLYDKRKTPKVSLEPYNLKEKWTLNVLDCHMYCFKLYICESFLPTYVCGSR